MKQAYKQGFRWKSVTTPVPPTTTPLVTPWSTTPIFSVVPSDPHTPTGAGLDTDTWTAPETPLALPWSTAPVPALPTVNPRPYWRFDKSLDLRTGIRATPALASSQVPVRTGASVSRPSVASTTTVPSTTAVPTVPPLTIAPVRVVGVPGSPHAGVNTVSDVYNKLNPIYFLFSR